MMQGGTQFTTSYPQQHAFTKNQQVRSKADYNVATVACLPTFVRCGRSPDEEAIHHEWFKVVAAGPLDSAGKAEEETGATASPSSAAMPQLTRRGSAKKPYNRSAWRISHLSRWWKICARR